MALRDLGFTLEQIRPLLDDDLSVDDLRRMLRIRRAQIEQDVSDDQARLRRVEAHLRALKGRQTLQIQDVVIKDTEPVRVAEIVGTTPGFGVENISAVFVPLFREAVELLRHQKVSPGVNIARYEEPADDGSVVLHVGFDIGDQDLADGERVRVIDLPAIKVAAVVHRGPMDGIAEAFDALMGWAKDSGYMLEGSSRELYLEWNDEDPTRHVTELQLPLGCLTARRVSCPASGLPNASAHALG